MICELTNKMEQFICFVLCQSSYIPKNKVSLPWFLFVFFLFFVDLIFVSWWIVPVRLVAKKLDNIVFYCKKGE